jgi:hypothetical protein
MARTSNPISVPAWDDVGDNETVIAITSPMDDMGRVSFVGFWRSAHGPGTPTFHNPFVGVRAQVFRTNLAWFVANAVRQGHTVRGLDDKSQAVLVSTRTLPTEQDAADPASRSGPADHDGNCR